MSTDMLRRLINCRFIRPIIIIIKSCGAFMQIGPAVSPEFKTSQTDDRQTTHCTKGATDSTVGQKLVARRFV